MKKKIILFICIPVIFTVLICGSLYVIGRPFIDVAYGVTSLFVNNTIPNFNINVVNDIYGGKPVYGQSETIAKTDIQAPKFGDKYGSLTCIDVGLDTPVIYGDTYDLLRQSACQYVGSFLPGEGKQILISGHNNSHFAPLKNIKEGNVVEFKTNYGTFEYEVTQVVVKDENDPTAYDFEKNEEELVMYTCYPFEKLVGRKTDRLFVYCKKISGPKLV